jgi:hypothetical protein
MVIVARSHSQQLLVGRLYSSIWNISQPGSNGETPGTCRRVPLKTSLTMFCSGKWHMALTEHSSSKPSKQAMGMYIQHTILMIQMTLHLPDGWPNTLADEKRLPCPCPSPLFLTMPIPTLPGLSLPMPRPSPQLMLHLLATHMTNQVAEILQRAKPSESNLAGDQRYNRHPTLNVPLLHISQIQLH